FRPAHRLRRHRGAGPEPDRPAVSRPRALPSPARAGLRARAAAATALAGLALGLLLGSVPAARAAQPQFWKLEGAQDFLDGDTEGLSVDSDGRVRLPPAPPAPPPAHPPSA